MPNSIKYTTGSETLALKKGNFYIGTGDVGKGPTSSTGYYNGITPPSGGYTIYLNKASGGPSIYTCTNDTQLISLTNAIAGQSYTTANECLIYFAGQTDKMVFNRDYEGIVTDGLVMNLDAGFTPSYPRNGTTWYDVRSSYSIPLYNSVGFSTNNGGYMDFDGSNDYAAINMSNTFISNPQLNNMVISFNLWVRVFSGYYILSTGGQTLSTGIAFSYQNGNGLWAVRGTSTGRYWVFDNGADFPTNTWINFCVTCGGSTMILYKNGTQLYSKPIDGSLNSYYGNNTPDNFTEMTIGRPNNFANFYSQCNLPIIQFYNKKLSSSEVLQNYNAQKGRFGL